MFEWRHLIDGEVIRHKNMKKTMMVIVMLIVAVVSVNAQVITSIGYEDGHKVIYLSNGTKVDGRLVPESNRLRVGETIQYGQSRIAYEEYAREAAKYQLPVGGGWYGGLGTTGITVGNKHAGFSISLPVGYPGMGAGVGVRIGSFYFNGNVPVFLLKKDTTKQRQQKQAQPKQQRQSQSVKVLRVPSTTQTTTDGENVMRIGGRDTVVRGEVNLNDLLRK